VTKSTADNTIIELKAVIGEMEVLSLKLAQHGYTIDDKKLLHTIKIIVGTIQAVRMYVMANQDILKNLLVKGGEQIGSKKKGRTKKGTT